MFFKKGEVLEIITGATLGMKRYTTVQISEKEHIELNSDIVYLNHSCDPTCIMDVKNMLVRLIKDVPVGGELTFFIQVLNGIWINPLDVGVRVPAALRP